MKIFLTSILLLLSSVCFSQNIITKLLNSSSEEIKKVMSSNLQGYHLNKDSLDSMNIKFLEFTLEKDSSNTGILVYLFYFESIYHNKCTSIRLIFYDEVKFKTIFKSFSKDLKRISANQWYDAANNVKISTFFVKENQPKELVFYFMDIEPYEYH